MAGKISMGARREVLAVVAVRYRTAVRREKGRILDELAATTGWHRKHAVRALAAMDATPAGGLRRERRRDGKYGAIRDALTALWEASDRVCGKRLVVMIPTLQDALKRHGQLQLSPSEAALLGSVSAATIDRLLSETKIAAAGGRRRRAGFHSAIRREVPVHTFDDWKDPLPGFCEVDMVAHCGTSTVGSFNQTLTMVDVATGWTECLPLVTREGALVIDAIKRVQSLFPWLLRGVDFDNDSAFMNDVVVPWCRNQKLEVTRARAYQKNDQAFVEQKNGAIVRRLVGYGRFAGVESAQLMARLYGAARLYINFFQPSFKLKAKWREGAKVIKRYHPPMVPYDRALAHPRLDKAVKQRLREQYRTLDPVALLAEIRVVQEELGARIGRGGGRTATPPTAQPTLPAAFAKEISLRRIEPRGTHRRGKRRYKTRMRMPSKLDPHLSAIESWLAAEPQLAALAIVGRLADRDPEHFGPKQHSIVQRLLKKMRIKAAQQPYGEPAALREKVEETSAATAGPMGDLG